jgi:hypothetical protein
MDTKSKFDGSILTIADAPRPGFFTPPSIEYRFSCSNSSKGDVLIHQNV